MKTHATRDSSRTGSGFFTADRIWKPLILAALVPLAAACTDTVTGLEQIDHEEETSIVDALPEDYDLPKDGDLPVAF